MRTLVYTVALVAMALVLSCHSTTVSRPAHNYPEASVIPLLTLDEEHGLPEGWLPFHFPDIPRATEYTTVSLPDGLALRAHANDAASALRTGVGIQPTDFPGISWSWKVDGTLSGVDTSVTAKDDCAARVMLLYRFDSDRESLFEQMKFSVAASFLGEEPPGSVLMYVWGEEVPVLTPIEGPRSDRVRVIALRRGKDQAGLWVDERRDHVADYRWAFGEDPPELAHISILVDTDDTDQRASAWLRGLVLHPRGNQ